MCVACAHLFEGSCVCRHTRVGVEIRCQYSSSGANYTVLWHNLSLAWDYLSRLVRHRPGTEIHHSLSPPNGYDVCGPPPAFETWVLRLPSKPFTNWMRENRVDCYLKVGREILYGILSRPFQLKLCTAENRVRRTQLYAKADTCSCAYWAYDAL